MYRQAVYYLMGNSSILGFGSVLWAVGARDNDFRVRRIYSALSGEVILFFVGGSFNVTDRT